MKRLFCLFITTIAIIVAVFSCRKSNEFRHDTDGVFLPSNEIESRIQAFMDRLNNHLKDGKTYSIDSSIWYSTAYLNYTYAIYDSALQHISCDTSTFSIELDEKNKVEETLLEEAIEQMTDSLEAQYDGLQESTKHLVYCMVYEIATYQGRLDVGMVSVIGFGYTPIFYEEFEEEDFWYSIFDYGKCDDCAPAYAGLSDAADQLEYKINHPLIASDPIYRIFTIPGSLDSVTVDSRDYYYANAPRDHRGYYYFANSESWPGPQCLDPNELNFYLSSNGLDYMIDDNWIGDLDLIYVEIEDELLLAEEFYEEIHFLKLRFGETYQTLVPASGL